DLQGSPAQAALPGQAKPGPPPVQQGRSQPVARRRRLGLRVGPRGRSGCGYCSQVHVTISLGQLLLARSTSEGKAEPSLARRANLNIPQGAAGSKCRLDGFAQEKSLSARCTTSPMASANRKARRRCDALQ